MATKKKKSHKNRERLQTQPTLTNNGGISSMIVGIESVSRRGIGNSITAVRRRKTRSSLSAIPEENEEETEIEYKDPDFNVIIDSSLLDEIEAEARAKIAREKREVPIPFVEQVKEIMN